MKQAPAGSELYLKLTYDHVDRLTDRYVGYGTGTTYALGSTVSSADTILEQLIANYDESSSADDANQTTQKTYNADGNVSTLTAWNASTGNQTTTYEYGTTLNDSEIASSLLTRRVLYPDSTDDSDSVTVTCNRQSDRITLTDQRGTVHTYAYDNLGRTVTDAVTTTGSRVDDSVLRLEWAYEVRGMLQTATSYDAASSGSAVNQVQWAYNDFGQLTTSYQEHSGTVNTGTTPSVQYGYANGSANTIRPTSLTYPDGRSLIGLRHFRPPYKHDAQASESVTSNTLACASCLYSRVFRQSCAVQLTYSYGTSGGTNDKASRVAGIVESSTTLAGYTYLGLGAVVNV
ncbi:hypothetical protein GC176_27065, partial [bacterium]|nr:hypothetical protein [bacterium]